VFDDPEAEKKYLTLDQLGFVLKHLSEQLPGRYSSDVEDLMFYNDSFFSKCDC
jgi:hypothetical protein